MDFAFTPEQEELRRQARSFLAANPEPTWEQLVELGWVGVSVPEEHGGLGLGFLEEAVLLEETARALMPGPWFATTVLAQPLLGAEQLSRVAAGEERWSAEVDGLVPNLGEVDFVVTADGPVPATGESGRTMDETRPLGRLGGGPGRSARSAWRNSRWWRCRDNRFPRVRSPRPAGAQPERRSCRSG